MDYLASGVHYAVNFIIPLTTKLPGTGTKTGLAVWALALVIAGVVIYYPPFFLLLRKGKSRVILVWQWVFFAVFFFPSAFYGAMLLRYSSGRIDFFAKSVSWVQYWGGDGKSIHWLSLPTWKFIGICLLIVFGAWFAAVFIENILVGSWRFDFSEMEEEPLMVDSTLWLVLGAIGGGLYGLFAMLGRKETLDFLNNRFATGSYSGFFTWMMFLSLVIVLLMFFFLVARAVISSGIFAPAWVACMLPVAATSFFLTAFMVPFVIVVLGVYFMLGGLAEAGSGRMSPVNFSGASKSLSPQEEFWKKSAVMQTM